MSLPKAPSERWWRAYLVALIPALLLGVFAVRRVLERAGEPALPLDDSFIHLQFAARLAKGHFFEYTPGGGYSSGATSFAWPIAFVPFFWGGLSGLDLVWVVWVFGTLLHAAVAYETWRLGRGLLGATGGLAAGAMCSAFGAFAWFAWSGMETLALSWLLLRTARVASEHAERPASERTNPPIALVLLAIVSPLVRPEGALASVLVVFTLLCDLGHPGSRARRGMAILAASLGPALIPLSHRFGTGHAASSTALVKHLAFDPYLDGQAVLGATLANVRLLVGDLLNGGNFTREFLPEGFVWLVAGGLIALPLLARRRNVGWRAFLVLLLALGTLGPTSYATLLWNRVRYLWPFAPAWFLLASALFVEVGHRLGRRVAMAGILAPALAWGLVATLATKLDGSTEDLATSARAIARQQVALGNWARGALPLDAVIGVNDTGAIAYFSERKTFDVVGLTTEGEAAYWARGAGSRFEHWERRRAAKLALPTHLIVYQGWMGMPAVYGPTLTDATVVEQSILGGATMTAMVADYRLLGSGEAPFSGPHGVLIDDLDVADMESEQAHAYELADARSHWCVAKVGSDPEGRSVADGGRLERVQDRFRSAVTKAARLVMRVASNGPLEVWADGKKLGTAAVVAEGEGFDERAIDLPENIQSIVVRPTQHERFRSFHYWWFEP